MRVRAEAGANNNSEQTAECYDSVMGVGGGISGTRNPLRSYPGFDSQESDS